MLSGDVPLVTGADLDAILEARREDDAAIALASVFAADPAELGRVVRGEFGTVERIVEARDATPDELAGNEINAGLYAFDAAWLRRRIGALTPSAATGELYLTDLVRLAREDGRLVSAVAFEDDGRFAGINDRSQLAAAEWSLRVRLNEAHMRAGVTMRDPSTAYLDWTVELGDGRHPRAERHPARRRRRSATGASSAPAASSSTRRSAPGVRVWASIVESSTVEDEATIGPFSHLRPGHGRRPRRRGRQLRRAQEHPPRRRLEAAPHELPRRRRRSARASTSAPARSPPTTTGRASTRRRSATARSSASTRCSSPRSRSGEGARTGAGAVVTRDVPAGKLAVGVPGPHPRAARPRRAEAAPPRAAPGRSATRGRRRRPGLDGHPPPDPGHRPPDLLRGRLRGRRDRPRDDAPDADRPAGRGGRSAAPSGSSASSPSPGRFLAVTQIGLTFLGFLASAYAAVNLTASLEQRARGAGHRRSCDRGRRLALIVVTLLLSLFTIVFGELVPKSLALAHTEQFALRLSGFIDVLLRVLGPLVAVADRGHQRGRPDARGRRRRRRT